MSTKEEIENQKIYEEEYLGKTKSPDPSKNPNYRRFTGLTNLVKTLKHEMDKIKAQKPDSNNYDTHVKLFINEQQVQAFRLVINHYESEIQSVKKKLELGIKNV